MRKINMKLDESGNPIGGIYNRYDILLKEIKELEKNKDHIKERGNAIRSAIFNMDARDKSDEEKEFASDKCTEFAILHLLADIIDEGAEYGFIDLIRILGSIQKGASIELEYLLRGGHEMPE